MAGLILPSRFTSQPQYAAPLVDQSLTVFDGRTGRVIGRPSVVGSSPLPGPFADQNGVGTYLQTISYWSNYSVSPISIGTGDFTLFIYYRVGIALTDTYDYLVGSDASTGFAFAPRHGSTGLRAALYLNGGFVDLGLNLSAVGTYKVVVSRVGGFVTCTANGVSGTPVSASAAASSITTLALNNYTTGAAGFGLPNCNVYLAGINPRRGWPVAEALAWEANPWQLFQAPSRIWVPSAGGTGPVNVSASIGAFSWAGVSSPLSTQIASTLGAYTWTGQQSRISAQINATVGAWVWAGTSSNLSAQVNSTTGAWSWAGITAQVAGLTTVNATTGTWVWAGSVSPLSTQLKATVGAWTWAGVTSTVSIIPQINATTGAWAWAGVTSTLKQQIGAGLGLWTWAGITSVVIVPTPTNGTLVMPSLVGMNWQEATATLIAAGITPNNGLLPGYVFSPLEYFAKWPVSLTWVKSKILPGTVLAQNPIASSAVSFNDPISLTVSSPPMGVSDLYSAGAYS